MGHRPALLKFCERLRIRNIYENFIHSSSCIGSAGIGQITFTIKPVLSEAEGRQTCLRQEVFLGIRESRIPFEESGWALSLTQTVFRHLDWLSLAGCTSTEPASVSPADTILVGCLIIVKFLSITMLFFWLCELLSQRRVWHLVWYGSSRLVLPACLQV